MPRPRSPDCRFGRLLDAALSERDMSSRELSEKLNVRTTAVSMWIHGHNAPAYPMLVRISRELGIDLTAAVEAIAADEEDRAK